MYPYPTFRAKYPPGLWIDRTLGTQTRTLRTRIRTLGTKSRTLGTGNVYMLLINLGFSSFFLPKTLKLYLKL